MLLKVFPSEHRMKNFLALIFNKRRKSTNLIFVISGNPHIHKSHVDYGGRPFGASLPVDFCGTNHHPNAAH